MTGARNEPAATDANVASMSTYPIQITATGKHPLGMPAAQFLRHYWQKRPLLIRNAFPDFHSPLTPEDLAGLACEEGSLGRIVHHRRAQDRWEVEHGPFPEALFPSLPQQDWTLLVQDVDKWDADVRALLAHFDFLPRWRIDDVMISFAAPGGSVGAHVDNYDVFLLQGHGHRRWQIDSRANASLEFRDDVELKLLRQFAPDHDWVLAPGDMLYLPPDVPHHGVAEDACLTYSIGMRAPSAADLMSDYIDTLISESSEAQRYLDPDLSPAGDSNEIDTTAMARVVDALNVLRMNDPERLGDWFGRFITRYRNAAEVMPAEQVPSRVEVEWALQHGALLLRHPWTRSAWRGSGKQARLYVDGQEFTVSRKDARQLAAADSLDGKAYARLSARGRDAVMVLLASGHYQLGRVDGGDEDE